MTTTNSGPVTMIVAGTPYPPTLSTAQTAQLWGCSPERLYAELGRGTLPVEPLVLGKRYRWPTLRVAEALSCPSRSSTRAMLPDRWRGPRRRLGPRTRRTRD
jgi:hypothetical protein